MKIINFIMCTLYVTFVSAQDRPLDEKFSTRSEIIAVHGMAATSQPLATQIALDILKQGGNAMDAAIAANAALGLMEPTGCGIGGDLFAIIWDNQTKKLYGLNASGRSPYALRLDYYHSQNMKEIPSSGPLPVTVPGCVDGWFEIHERFGKLGMEPILQPAIRYAREGFPLSPVIAAAWKGEILRLREFPNIMEIYTMAGHSPEKGEIFKNPDLANTLEKIALGGRDAFYRGEITKTMVDYIEAQGGFLSLRDFTDHRSEWVNPLSTQYRGYDVWELPPNGQGIAVLQMLNILEAYDLKQYGFGSADYLHLLTEVKKLVYEDRARYYADPEFTNLPINWLISKDYAQQRRKLINLRQAARAYESGTMPLEEGDTVYLTVADSAGNMISLIQSNYEGMGSGMAPPGLGFVLQNRGVLFSLEKDHPNVYEPHKRPFHTIIPGFVTRNGQPYMSFGVMGGAMQPQGQVQVLINIIDFGMNLQEAGDAPRIRHTGSSQPTGGKMSDGGWLNAESGISAETIRELERRGHQVRYRQMSYGGYQAIMWDQEKGVYIGASESRKDGQAAGY
ncbi:MAG: gamma-glutamyltransferase [bacterium]|nr:MAG: gamma-glutamyltransferase [bacterium]